jgi:putative endopeptidase
MPSANVQRVRDGSSRRFIGIVCALISIITLTAAADSPRFGQFGLDLTSIDKSVKPGDDFYRYAEGHWLKTAIIPQDRSSWGVFDDLNERTQQEVSAILEAASAAGAPTGSTTQKIGDYYAAFLDTERIDQLGLRPARSWLEAIAALKTHAQAAALIAKPGSPLDGPFQFVIKVDERNPDRYILRIGQSGLSLPDREYYLKTEPQFADIRAKFQAHIARMLSLAGHDDAELEASRVLVLETEIAKLHWDRAKRRERDLMYNPMRIAAVKKQANAYPWESAFRAAGLTGPSPAPGLTEVVVDEWSAAPALARLFVSTPISTWRSYLTYHFLNGESAALARPFDDEHFDFYGRILAGQPEQRGRRKRAVEATNEALGEAVGEQYVVRYFPPESRAQVQLIVASLRKAYAAHISSVPWMTRETKQAATEKLEAFHAKIGYPDKWRDYSKLVIERTDAFGNRERAHAFEWQRQVARLNEPTDHDEWGMTPQEVNAYYEDTFNEIVFPAAVLQPPLFDPHADPAVNYGAVGGVIGHEMGHGFDDQGAKSDARGVLRTWWRQADIDAFSQRTAALVAQYSEFEPVKGLHVNGQQTLGENIGDLGGLSIAYDAYRISLGDSQPPVIDGLTGDQRYFLSWAQLWRSVNREEDLRNQVLSNVHSPKEFRVNGVVRNVDAWYKAFGVNAGDKLYLAPESRVSIW